MPHLVNAASGAAIAPATGDGTVVEGRPKHEFKDLKFPIKRLDDAADWYCALAVKKPRCTFVFWWFVVALMIVVGVVSGAKFQVFTYVDWLIPDAPQVERMDMLTSAHEQIDDIGNVTERSKTAYYQLMNYESISGKDIFTAGNLQHMCEFENTLLGLKEYEDFCVVENGECATPTGSIVYWFYGENATQDDSYEWDCFLLDDDRVESKAATLVNRMQTEEGQVAFGFFMSKKTNKKGFSTLTRSSVGVGGPLRGYSTLSQAGADGQTDEYYEFSGAYSEELWKEYHMTGNAFRSAFMDKIRLGDLDITVYSFYQVDWETLRLFLMDLAIVLFALVFVYSWLVFHTQSLWMATVGIFQVFMSLPASLFFYTGLFRITYFGMLQILSIFVILGIGADDIFVFNDAWKQSGADIPAPADGGIDDWLIRRMRYTYKRSSQAVFTTSFTTAMAFCATAVSPIMPISTFGIYSAVAILMNLLFLITITPATVIIMERYTIPCSHWLTEKRQQHCLCCTVCPRRRLCSWLPCRGESDQTGNSRKTLAKQASGEQEPDKPDHTCTLFGAFRRRYLVLLTHRPTNAVLVAIITAIICLMAWRASLLTPPIEQERWLAKEHMLQRAYDANDDYFVFGEDDYGELEIVWGLKRLDRSNFDPYVPAKNRGDVVFDAQFDLFNQATQDVIYDACERLPTYPCGKDGCDFDLLVLYNTTICFLTSFDSWAASEHGVDTAALVSHGSEQNRTRYFSLLKKFRTSQHPLGDSAKSYDQIIGFVDDEVKFVKVKARLSMLLLSPVEIKIPVEKRCEAFVKSLDQPKHAKSVWMFSFAFTWSPSEAGVVTGMQTGMSIAFPIAFATLLFVTNNLVLSLFAIVSVGGVVASTLGAAQLMGWDLGTGEAIAGVMVIGLSVDFTIHFGHLYNHAAFEHCSTAPMVHHTLGPVAHWLACSLAVPAD